MLVMVSVVCALVMVSVVCASHVCGVCVLVMCGVYQNQWELD